MVGGRRLKMTHRKAVTSEAAYRTASKKQKSRILDEHVALTGRNRSYLSWLLRCWGPTVVERRDGEVVKTWSASAAAGAAAPASTTSRSWRR